MKCKLLQIIQVNVSFFFHFGEKSKMRELGPAQVFFLINRSTNKPNSARNSDKSQASDVKIECARLILSLQKIGHIFAQIFHLAKNGSSV